MTRAIKRITPQQERYCQEIVAGMSQLEAYRKAYPKSVAWKDSSASCEASKLAACPLIIARIKELRAPVIAQVQTKMRYTIEQAMAEAEEAMEICRAKENGGAFVSAVTLRAKLNNLLIDQKNIRMSVLDELDHGQLRSLEDELRAIANNAGLGSQTAH